MVIIVGNGYGNPVSNAGGVCLHFMSANTLWKDTNPTILPEAMGK